MLFGLACIYSSTIHTTAAGIYTKQAWGMIIGICMYIAFSLFPAYQLRQLGYYGFYIATGLLILTALQGTIGMGAQRWLHIAGFTFQPAELMKLATPFFIINYLSHREHIVITKNIYEFLRLYVILTCTWILVLKQPDLGTAILLSIANSVLLWIAGFPSRYFIYLCVALAISTPISWYYIKPYQRERVRVFLGSGSSHNERYHIEQSRIAIGSGGIWGKGWQHGTQNQLRFLPERRTDFIFSVLCEEFGFLGAMLLMIIYATLFGRIIYSVYTITSVYPKLLIIGIMLPHALSVIINISMVMGLLPIVGIPLPLMSYGLSHLWTTCISFGSINSIIDKWKYR